MPTFLLSARYTADSQRLWRAAVHRGWDVHRLSGWNVPESIRSVAEPVLYVDALTGPIFAEQLGIALEEPPSDWLPRLLPEYRKRDVRVSTLGDARQISEPKFVKPPNDKSFGAQVYIGVDLPSELPDDMPVLIAEVVEWEKEFRCFILDRKLRTFSIYLRGGELQEDSDFATPNDEMDELCTFLEMLLADERVDLLQASVLDVGVIRERGWAVVEQNSAWGAGIYGCDPEEVLSILQVASSKHANE